MAALEQHKIIASDHCEDVQKDAEQLQPPPTMASALGEAELAAFERKMVLKLDLILVPTVAMIYFLAFLDRANIGNARVAGLQEDLGLTDHQYQTAITVTYVPYIVAELPSNLLLKKVGPRLLLAFICTSWGIITTLQSQVHNFAGLLACRFFLGLAEGGLVPGLVLYLSCFYRRHELQIRIALFFSAVALSGAFSGLLAAAIEKMDGVGSLRGWQWIFCLEGLFTVLFGVVSYFILPNTPYQVRTFTQEQADYCVVRLKSDVEFPETEKVTVKTVLSIFRSPHLVLLCICVFCSGACLFGLAYFTPSIVQAFGYSRTQTQLLTVPPFMVAFFVTMLTAWCADRYRQRGIAALVTWSLGLIGIVMFYKGRSIAVRYTSLFLVITGVYAASPCLMAWIANNAAAHVRRASVLAVGFMGSNIGGIVSTWIFPKKDAPYYSFAASFVLALTCIGLTTIGALIWGLRYLNARKEDPEYREKVLRDLQHLTFPEQIGILGDKHPDYKYTY